MFHLIYLNPLNELAKGLLISEKMRARRHQHRFHSAREEGGSQSFSGFECVERERERASEAPVCACTCAGVLDAG
jgi:hypothetical protein